MTQISNMASQNDSNQRNVVVGLDIGTTKICALVAAKDDNSENLKILGVGITDSEGVSRGIVVKPEKASHAIENAIRQASQQSGINIKDVYISISGDHIESTTSKGIISITDYVTQDDVKRLIDESRKINLSNELHILHAITQEFILDGDKGIVDPIGMCGLRFEADVHLITCSKNYLNRIHDCVQRAGYEVKDVFLSPMANAKALLTKDEEEVGVAVVDIGGGTTEVIVIANNIIRHISIFGIAGYQITSDLSSVLQITLSNAEKIKREHGLAYPELIEHDEVVMIPAAYGRKHNEVLKSQVSEILEPRIREIFEIINRELEVSNFKDKLGAGVVITGGTTLLHGIENVAADVLQLPVRIGIPTGLTSGGLTPETERPEYSTAAGLARWAFETLKYQTPTVNVANTVEAPPKERPTFGNDEDYERKPNTKSGPIINKVPPYGDVIKDNQDSTKNEPVAKEGNTIKDFYEKLKSTLKNL